jgi:hypothetical protein
VFRGFNLFNYDLRSITSEDVTVTLNPAGDNVVLVDAKSNQGLELLNTEPDVAGAISAADDAVPIVLQFKFAATDIEAGTYPIVADFFSFGMVNDGLESDERIANQIVRLELEESGDNTSTFIGTLEYVMINQLNILDSVVYSGLTPISDEASFVVIEDLDDEESPRVNYLDLGADGVSTQIADQEEAPSHSGVVSLDMDSYKVADTVTITLEDQDLNVDTDLIDIYTVVSTAASETFNQVGEDIPSGQNLSFGDLGRLVDITFDDLLWASPRVNDDADFNDAGEECGKALFDAGIDTGLDATGFTLIETSKASGVFVGTFQVPSQHCVITQSATAPFAWKATPVSTTGLDIEVNYVDFRDASGEIIEVGDSAGIRATTGSVSLDRTVYPVPFGIPANFAGSDGDDKTTPSGRSVFPVHQTGTDVTNAAVELGTGEYLANGDLIVHVRVNDPDFDVSASGEDTIAINSAGTAHGPVKISVIRGANAVVLGYAGSEKKVSGVIDVGNNAINVQNGPGGDLVFANDGSKNDVDSAGDTDKIKEIVGGIGFNNEDDVLIIQFGPMQEIAPDAGIFEADIIIRYTDGPASTQCPETFVYKATDGTADTTVTSRFDIAPITEGTNYCILQGDILQVEYTDPTDASGDINTVTDSATFDLRNGVLQSDKSVYIIGSDMILTLIEPDLDLNNDQAETYSLDLVEWDSDAATCTVGNQGAVAGCDPAAFDPEPTSFREQVTALVYSRL